MGFLGLTFCLPRPRVLRRRRPAWLSRPWWRRPNSRRRQSGVASPRNTSCRFWRKLTSPHKLYGPEQNDLALQLRKNGVDQVILVGMSANLCVEAHMRELLEMGFEVAVVSDATAAAKLPEGDGYLAAIINFRCIANAVWAAEEAVSLIEALQSSFSRRQGQQRKMKPDGDKSS
ncbi:MAG: isochorismatase family protein [Pseudorhodobacter sp.]|nr:isochorismatase family protein [Pseudorhodobacter sp.]